MGTPKSLAEAIENGMKSGDLAIHIRDYLAQGVGILTLSDNEDVVRAGEYLAEKWGLGAKPESDADDWEEYENEDEDGLCMACKEHSHAVYMRNKKTGELADQMSACCSAGINIP